MMTEEQKHAEAELEKTLGTLSEEELDMLAGGKVTDDVKKFFKSEKGKEVMKWIGIGAGTAVGVGTAIGVTAALVSRHRKKPETSIREPQSGMEYGDEDFSLLAQRTIDPNSGMEYGEDIEYP